MTPLTPLEQVRRDVAATGRLIDLAGSDFRSAGLAMPEELYQEAWALWRSRPGYEPTGLGGAAARDAVAEFLTRDGLPTTPEQVVLTAGSSVSYQLLFSVLPSPDDSRRSVRPGRDALALPAPAYPLFEDLCRVAGLRPVWYRLSPEEEYDPDPLSLAAALAESPRAVVVISPNNPTGAIHGAPALSGLVHAAMERNVPVISDEVFSAFRDGPILPRAALQRGAPEPGSPVVATLNGLSKLCAAPEIKLGWIALHGPDAADARLLDALDTLHDSFLTVSGFAESCARVFLAPAATPAREAIAHGIARRRDLLRRTLSGVPGVTVEPSRGGVHLVVSLSAEIAAERFGTTDDETLARRILAASGVHLHPGYLYALGERPGSIDPRFIVSCVHRPDQIEEAGERLNRVFPAR